MLEAVHIAASQCGLEVRRSAALLSIHPVGRGGEGAQRPYLRQYASDHRQFVSGEKRLPR